LDFFNLYLILLTSLIFSIAILSNWNSNLMHSSYLFLFLLFWVELLLFVAFSSLDLFIFFISFEGITIPTFFLIYL
jgi:NADH:ubiquinone oxidoreductase subunit 4 (subunit M)